MDKTLADNISASQPDDHALIRSAAERAYGLLWMYLGTDKLAHEARRHLLSQIGSEGQSRGIAYAKAKHGEPDLSKLMASTDHIEEADQ